jgi:LmbE family N-acetylglucosaminyl deacetylase
MPVSDPLLPGRALFISAHPDDIEFGAGGLAALWARAGSELTYALVTDGNVGSHEPDMTKDRLIALRRDEQRAAARLAGAAECVFLGYHDGLLQSTLELRRDIVRLIRTYRPDAVITFDPDDLFPSDQYIHHPDHRATAISTIEAIHPAAMRPSPYPELEAEGLEPHRVSQLLLSAESRGNYVVDVSAVMDMKLAALREHRSQFVDWSPDEMVLAWGRAIGKQVGFAFGEAFDRFDLDWSMPQCDW